ncbi:rhomboid family intramembrane serine protease [Phaeobacter sp. 11ANDIMAR09]|uniref:rhomboid family intramembrane serine protease n=1 Tax=Phaeobacter sp. 11ANDIMAR09 TaxID=1225647 RepID=UPI0006C85AFE|nr:rhomboid family intramembrane serine protease [Phaeobacter sp. 11ANDIMAR09]KPD13998.1 protease [Phaeobacter sp. 11ANDIMAR09]OIQ35338.1 MAG: rhomboid family intramembrane serine protease [Roseobacter sp. MedPE-SWchi]
MNLERFYWLAILIAVIWAVQGVNLISGYALNDWFGLIPRSIGGLDGVVMMPFLHGSLSHIASNTVPLVVLGGLLTLTAPRLILQASAIVVVFGGLGLWLFGASAIHVGASGLIFGWFGFLVTRGLIEKRPLPLLVAIGVAFFYGTMIWGLLPGQPGVSWEAHLFGCLAGVFAGYALRSRA